MCTCIYMCMCICVCFCMCQYSFALLKQSFFFFFISWWTRGHFPVSGLVETFTLTLYFDPHAALLRAAQSSFFSLCWCTSVCAHQWRLLLPNVRPQCLRAQTAIFPLSKYQKYTPFWLFFPIPAEQMRVIGCCNMGGTRHVAVWLSWHLVAACTRAACLSDKLKLRSTGARWTPHFLKEIN